MVHRIYKTGERFVPSSVESEHEHLMYLRHLCAYEYVKSLLSGSAIVLEAGCGEGYGTKLLSSTVGSIVGLDVHKNTIAHATRKYGSDNCTFRLYDGQSIPYEDETFDAVVSFQVIEHIHDDANYISEIHRVLRKDGTLLLTTPNATNRLKPGQKPWNKFHVREYRPAELKSALEAKFTNAIIWGISAIDQIQQIEKERLEGIIARKSAVLAFLVRNTPDPVMALLKSVLKGRFWPRTSKDSQTCPSQYNVNDFHITKENVSKSLDLLGVCTK